MEIVNTHMSQKLRFLLYSHGYNADPATPFCNLAGDLQNTIVQPPHTIVAHFAPDLDCIAAIWIIMRFGKARGAELRFVPAGNTLDGRPPDTDPGVLHVDTGGGRYDHHHSADHLVSAAELVRRAYAPTNQALRQLVDQVTRIDHAESGAYFSAFTISDLIAGYNLLHPSSPRQVVEAMLPNLDAWYEIEVRQLRLEQAFVQRIEFDTCWGRAIALQSDDGGGSRLAYRRGAVLYLYRDRRGYMGLAAQQRSTVDLAEIYSELRRVDGEAEWYLHPNHRLLLCGTPKHPPRERSQLSLQELIDIVRGQGKGQKAKRDA